MVITTGKVPLDHPAHGIPQAVQLASPTQSIHGIRRRVMLSLEACEACGPACSASHHARGVPNRRNRAL